MFCSWALGCPHLPPTPQPPLSRIPRLDGAIAAAAASVSAAAAAPAASELRIHLEAAELLNKCGKDRRAVTDAGLCLASRGIRKGGGRLCGTFRRREVWFLRLVFSQEPSCLPPQTPLLTNGRVTVIFTAVVGALDNYPCVTDGRSAADSTGMTKVRAC